MDKAPDAYRTISEVAEDLDLPQHVLRFWETRFSQIKPLKRGGGRRYYRPDDVELLKGIRHLLYKEGYTIKGVQRILKEQGARAVQSFAQGGEPEAPPAPALAARPAMPPAARPPATPPAPAPAPFMPAPVMTAPVMPAPVMPASPVPSEPALPAYPSAPVNPVPPALLAAETAVALPEEALGPNPDLENWQPEPEDEPSAGIAITLEQGPPPPPPPQVSMFRGGLARGEGVVPPPPRPAGEMAAAVPPSAAARESVRYALDELVSCRAMIDRILARRQTV